MRYEKSYLKIPGGDSRPLVFVLVDALRGDFVSPETTPFLARFAREGGFIPRVVPGYGFCERAELWTGAMPNITDMFTAVTLNWDGESPAYFLQHLCECLPFYLPRKLDFALRLGLSNLLKLFKKNLPIFDIPIPILPYCVLTEDAKDHRIPGAFPVPSFFEEAARHNKRIFYDTFTALGMMNGSDEDRLRLLLDSLDKGHDLYLLYLGKIDAVGHRFGTCSVELREALTRVDAQIEKLWQKIDGHCDLIVLGDHGMVDVEIVLDLGGRLLNFLGRHGFRLGTDFGLFVDSTMLRIWVRSERVRKPCVAFLQSDEWEEHGKLLNEEVSQHMFLPSLGGKYGDIVWLANPGVLIHPCFYHRTKAPVAMHGYRPDHENQAGCIISNFHLGEGFGDSVQLHEVGSIIAYQLGFSFPSGYKRI